MAFQITKTDDINIVRVHNENFKATTDKKAVEETVKMIKTSVNKFANSEEGKKLKKRTTTSGQNRGNISGRKFTKESVISRATKRAANKSEKEACAKYVQEILKADNDLNFKVLACIQDYSKMFSLKMEDNVTIIENAIVKASKNGFYPQLYLDTFDLFIEDYNVILFPLIEKAELKGANPKFLSWGVIMEGYKAELSQIVTEIMTAAHPDDISMKFLYSKSAMYGCTWDEAQNFTRRCVFSVIRTVQHLTTTFPTFKLTRDPQISVETVKAQYNGIKDKLDVSKIITAKEALVKAAAMKWADLKTASLDASVMYAVGITPYAIMQNHQYKIGQQNDPAMVEKTHNEVCYIMTIIRMSFEKLFAVKNPYTSKRFIDCRAQMFEMWRNMVVYARTLRQYAFPQTSSGINANIELDMLDTAFITEKVTADLDFLLKE